MQINSLEYALLILIGALLGIAAGWLVGRAKISERYVSSLSEKETALASLTESVRGKNQQLEDLNRRLERTENRLESMRNELLSLSRENADLKSRLMTAGNLEEKLAQRHEEANELREKAAELRRQNTKLVVLIQKERSETAEKIQVFQDLEKRLVSTYKGLSAEALRENNQSFLDLAQTTFSKYMDGAGQELDARTKAVRDAIAPVKEALHRYENHLQAMERARENAHGGLLQQVTSLNKTQEALRKETGKLVNSLRVPQVRGRWGELTLKRVVELAGMVERCDFYQQQTARGTSGALRPDMLVRLPGNRAIVVDAKVSLDAFLSAMEAESDRDREKALFKHARQLENHVNQLSQKSYWNQFSPTPEFVVLFIPGESFFSAALARAPELIENAARKGVILSTPTTLISLLKSVSFGWRQEKMAQNAMKISELGRVLYRRLSRMAGNVNRLGADIDRCAKTFNEMVGNIEHRVMVSARRFGDLGLDRAEDTEADTFQITRAETNTRKMEEEGESS